MVSAKIVGELACQQNSYLYELQTKVVSCVEVVSSKADTKRTKKNKEKDQKTQSTTTNGDDTKLWEVECEDSVLFPEGGGQPTDHGTLITSDDPNNPISINTVHRHGLRAVMFLPRPLAPGTMVTQHVNSRRRMDIRKRAHQIYWNIRCQNGHNFRANFLMDHMQQHTGQHLLSAIMDSYPGLETLGWSMGASIVGDDSPSEKLPNINYVELGRKPTEAEIAEIQDKCNEIVMQNRPITVSTPKDAKHDSLPEDYDKEKGIVRVVTIDGIDENPCCGTHLSQTSHIGPILLHYTQPIRGTNTRLFFTCGERSIALAASTIRAARTVAATLSTGPTPSELTSRATQVTDSLRNALRAKRKLETEIAGYMASKVIQDKSVWVHRADAGLDFLMDIATEIPAEHLPGALILATGTGAGGGSVLIIGNNAEQVQGCASKATAAVSNLKGGGKGVRWQGKVQAWEKGNLSALEKIANEYHYN